MTYPIAVPVCMSCARWQESRECEAFSEIPDLIWIAGGSHNALTGGEDKVPLTFTPREDEGGQ